MNFEARPERKPDNDQAMRDLERVAKASPEDAVAQESYFVALCRAGRGEDHAAQQRLVSALIKNRSSVAVADHLNRIFDQFGLQRRGRVVEVHSSNEAESQTQLTERRWVTWKRTYEQSGEEIPASIDRIYRVAVPNKPLVKSIDDAGFEYVQAFARDVAAEIDANRVTTLEDIHEIASVKFERSFTTEELNKWLENNQFSSSCDELLTVVTTVSDLDRSSFMIALDKRWVSRGCIPAIYDDNLVHCFGVFDQGSFSNAYRCVASRSEK